MSVLFVIMLLAYLAASYLDIKSSINFETNRFMRHRWWRKVFVKPNGLLRPVNAWILTGVVAGVLTILVLLFKTWFPESKTDQYAAGAFLFLVGFVVRFVWSRKNEKGNRNAGERREYKGHLIFVKPAEFNYWVARTCVNYKFLAFTADKETALKQAIDAIDNG